MYLAYENGSLAIEYWLAALFYYEKQIVYNLIIAELL